MNKYGLFLCLPMLCACSILERDKDEIKKVAHDIVEESIDQAFPERGHADTGD